VRAARVALLALALAGPAPGAAQELHNRLADNPSPYLALHGADPVAWQVWGPEVMDLARRTHRLVYVSVGYFSCHWCHVMQRESYRDPKIAAFLNRHFIPVKVDRELEPALDARLIDFAERTRGMGGWPLNVFITPDGYPLYAVLYLPPAQFMSALTQLQELWRDDPDALRKLASDAAPGGKGPGEPRLARARVDDLVGRVVRAALEQGDPVHGGFGDQSKFPSVPQLQFLLAQLERQDRPELRAFLELTLEQMADGGLRDHLAGGFFRYTVDPDWRTPHFEKMLYDNAQLASLYWRAARVLKRRDFQELAEATAAFMVRELTSPAGALLASLSALDGKGVEGGYYLWSAADLERLLDPAERAVARATWGMRDAAPFDAGYLPVRGEHLAEVARARGIGLEEAQHLFERASAKLRAERAHRTAPADTKLLAGWNGLALATFAELARGTDEARWREAGARVAAYLGKRLWNGRELYRALDAGGRPIGRAGLEDYAYAADGLFAWALYTGKPADLAVARAVLDQAWTRFYGGHGWRLGESSLIQAEPPRDVVLDGPMPSPSGVVLDVSLRLARHASDSALRDQALAALNSGNTDLDENPFWCATQIGAMREAF